jgi:hypothetical protein
MAGISDAAEGPSVAETAPSWVHVKHSRRLWRVRRRLDALWGSTLVYSLMALLFAPPLIFFGLGLWATVAYAKALVAIWGVFRAWDLAALFAQLRSARFVAVFALASGAYFALLFSLIVLFAGLFGRRWRRLALLPGILFGVPSTLLFVAGMEAAAADFMAKYTLPGALAPLLTGYALVDVVLLAGYLTDARAKGRRKRLAEQETEPMPIVRFGPPLFGTTQRGFAPLAASERRGGTALRLSSSERLGGSLSTSRMAAVERPAEDDESESAMADSLGNSVLPFVVALGVPAAVTALADPDSSAAIAQPALEGVRLDTTEGGDLVSGAPAPQSGEIREDAERRV